MSQTATYTATIPITGSPFPDIVRIYWVSGQWMMHTFSPPVSLDPSLTVELIAALNALGIGTWSAVNDGSIATLTTNLNPNSFTIVAISNGTDVNFVESNVVITNEIYGCTNPNAINYNPLATADDGTCLFDNAIVGCTDIRAKNFNPNATVDDGSCIYEPDDVQKIRCCYAKTAQDISEKEMGGEAIPCCMHKKLNYLEGILYTIENYIRVGDIIGHTQELTGTIVDFPNYNENTNNDVVLTTQYIEGFNEIKYYTQDLIGNSITGRLKIYVESLDGSITHEIGYLDGTFADLSIMAQSLNDLFQNRYNPNNPDGVNEILSQYTSIYDVVRVAVVITPFTTLQNNLRDGNNNGGAFRDGRRIRASISVTYTSDICDYGLAFTADSNDGLIPCSGTPFPSTVSFSGACSGAVTLTATNVSSAFGISYQWQSSPDNMAWSDVIGETSTTLVINPDGNYYRLKTICSFSSLDNYSNSVLPVNSPLPIPLILTGGDVCSGSDISLSGNNIAIGQNTGNSYLWTGSNGFTSTQQNVNINEGSQYYPSEGSSITVTLQVTNIYGCVATSDPYVIYVNQIPTLSIQYTAVDSVLIIASGGTDPYDFTLDFVNFNQTGVFDNLNNGFYQVYVSDYNGCLASPLLFNIPESIIDVVADGIGEIVVVNNNGTAPFVFTLYDLNYNLLTVNDAFPNDTNPSAPKADSETCSWVSISGYGYVTPPNTIIIKMQDSNGVISLLNYTLPN
jgi:hypothetical protein